MPKQAFPAAAEGVPSRHESKDKLGDELLPLIRAIDILSEGRGFSRCAWQAASSLEDGNVRDGMMTVLNMVEVDIDHALEVLRGIVDRIKSKGGEA
jgi:hypothetical protein